MVLPPSMQGLLPAGWLATGRESNSLDRYKRFQVIHPPFLDLAWRKGSFILNLPFTSLDHFVGQRHQRGWKFARHVGARSRKTCDEPRPHRIANADDNDRDRPGRVLGCQRCLRYHRNNNVNIELDQLRRKLRESIKPPVGKSVIDDDVLSLDVAKLAQLTPEFIVVVQWPG